MFNVDRITDGIPATFKLLSEMWPPDFSRFPQWIEPLLDTLAMSVAGTAMAIGLSLPLGLLAATNTTPHPIAFHIVRTVLNITRAMRVKLRLCSNSQGH